jgi:hypothetical protein
MNSDRLTKTSRAHLGMFLGWAPTRKTEMSSKEHKKEIGVKWIKAQSGNTYLCPVDALERLSNPTEDQLKMICVDESQNPENA